MNEQISTVQPAVSPWPEILVVDDDADVRGMLADVLAMEGYRTAEADGGRTALTYLRSGHRPAVILLDLMMPDMDGWQFRAAQLGDPRLAGIPVIVLTADSREHQKACELGIARGLRKPIDLDQLLAAVAEYRAG